MRTVDTLFKLEEIIILWQYLYMNEDHYITIDNGVTKLEIRMRDNCSFHAKNLQFPDLPGLDYTDMMVIPNMLGIIGQLKNVPPEEFKEDFRSRWEEIRAITLDTITLNKLKSKKFR